MLKKLWNAGLPLILLLYFFTLVMHISANHEKYQWDFRTHRMAGQVWADGENPYDPSVLDPRSGTGFVYNYPPVTLLFYRLFTLVDYNTAFHVFLVIKCVLLVGLIYFWKRVFLEADGDTLFYLFCLLVFNNVFFLDLIAGNINLLEQVFLWLGFYCFLKQKPYPFIILVILAASFKMTLAFFLVLLLLDESPRKYASFGIGAGLFGAYLLIQYLIAPRMFGDMLRNAFAVVSEPGAVGPTTHKLVQELMQLIGNLTGVDLSGAVWLLVAGLTLLVIGLSARAYLTLPTGSSREKNIQIIFMVCLVYALIHPRFKDYAYMLLIVPTYQIIKNAGRRSAFPLLFILAVMASPHWFLPLLDSLSTLFWKYYPLLIAFGVWGLYIHGIYAAADPSPETRLPVRKPRSL
jgi:hypothetical protein